MNLAENPDWFDRRRFVTDRPADSRNFNDWGVRDLATNIVLINGISGEEAGLYADTLEVKYNRYGAPAPSENASDA